MIFEWGRKLNFPIKKRSLKDKVLGEFLKPRTII